MKRRGGVTTRSWTSLSFFLPLADAVPGGGFGEGEEVLSPLLYTNFSFSFPQGGGGGRRAREKRKRRPAT